MLLVHDAGRMDVTSCCRRDATTNVLRRLMGSYDAYKRPRASFYVKNEGYQLSTRERNL